MQTSTTKVPPKTTSPVRPKKTQNSTQQHKADESDSSTKSTGARSKTKPVTKQKTISTLNYSSSEEENMMETDFSRKRRYFDSPPTQRPSKQEKKNTHGSHRHDSLERNVKTDYRSIPVIGSNAITK